jgi:acetolactate synthase-1/2/3 large subunit
MKASDLFVKALENEGVKYIFGVPGEENLDFVDSLRHSSIQLVTVRHEQSAGFMAATYGRLTGKTGVCLSTLGPGATNFVTAAAYAQLGGMPMLMITGQKPIKASKQGLFQIVNIVSMMKPLTKLTQQIVDGHTIPALVRNCFRISQRERPGAVHLELPEDIAQEDSESQIFEVNPRIRSVASEKAIKQAAQMLHDAKRPLLLIGAGANRKEITNALQQLLDKTKLPYFTTQMGKGVLDEREGLCLGTAAISEGDFVHVAIEKADLILNIGHDVIEKPPFFMHESDMKVIHMNFSHSRTDEVYFPQLDVVGDLNHSIRNLVEHLEPNPHWDFSGFAKIKTAIDLNMRVGIDDERFPVNPLRLVHDVRQAVPEDGIIALDNGMYKIFFARNYPAFHPNTVLLDNALATMGAGVPSALAAKLVYPDRPVCAICGDGGFMMNSQDLEVAVRLKLHVVIIVLQDNGFGMIKWKQKNMHLSDFGLDFHNPDFVKYAESYGAHGHRVESAAQVKTVLEHCFQTNGVHLVNIPVDYSENGEIFGSRLAAQVDSVK